MLQVYRFNTKQWFLTQNEVLKWYENIQSQLLLHVMKSTKSGLNNNAGPNALLAPFRPADLKKNFGEWRLEKRKKLDVKTRPILSQVCWNQQATWQQLWGKYGQVLVKSASAIVKLNIIFIVVFFLCCFFV